MENQKADIQRFTQWCAYTHKHGLNPHPSGELVRYEDYAALRAQLNEAQWTAVREKIRAATAEQAGHTMYAALRSYVQAVKGVLAERDRVEAEADAWCKEYRWP